MCAEAATDLQLGHGCLLLLQRMSLQLPQAYAWTPVCLSLAVSSPDLAVMLLVLQQHHVPADPSISMLPDDTWRYFVAQQKAGGQQEDRTGSRLIDMAVL